MRSIVLLAALGFCAAASSGASDFRPVVIQGLGDDANAGIYDPSLAREANGRLWMSYSAVQYGATYEGALPFISTRLAYSDDDGEHWRDSAVVNPSTPIDGAVKGDVKAAQWEHEVSSLLHDPGDPEPSRQWKLLWHRYPRVIVGASNTPARLFQLGWIELRTAPHPEGPWSSGRRLFVGSRYERHDHDDRDDPLGVAMHLDAIPGLKQCAAFTEPGMVAREHHVYVVLRCAPLPGEPGGLVAVLRCDRAFAECEYTGALLEDPQAARFGSDYRSFSGTDLVDRNGATFLIASPTEGAADEYRGCLLFRVTSLEPAALETEGGAPRLALRVGARNTVNGACGAPASPSAAGLFLSVYSDLTLPNFRIVATGRSPG